MAEEHAMAEVLNLLEAEPTTSEPGLSGIVQGTDIPALCEQLAVLVSTGKCKQSIGVELTHEQVKHLTENDVEKYSKRYANFVGAKTTESLIDSFIYFVTKAVGMVVDIKDVEAYQKELKKDYIINKELSGLASALAFKCGRFLAVANAALITTKHIDFSKHADESAVQQSPIF